MLLRQYFMSLKILDRWSHLGPHMSSHWDKVATNVARSHPCLPPKQRGATSPTAEKTSAPSNKPKGQKSSWEHWTPAKIRARRSSVGPLSERETDVDENDQEQTNKEGDEAEIRPPQSSVGVQKAPLDEIREDDEDEERELQIMRKVFRRWCRKAGVQAEAGSDLEEDDVDCDWTQAIAPKVEGRINMVGSAD